MSHSTVTIEVDDDFNLMMPFTADNRNWHPNREICMVYLKAMLNYQYLRLRAQGYLFLNDFLNELGFNRIPEGQILGWTIGTTSPLLWEISFDNDPEAPITLYIKPDGVIYDKI